MITGRVWFGQVDQLIELIIYPDSLNIGCFWGVNNELVQVFIVFGPLRKNVRSPGSAQWSFMFS